MYYTYFGQGSALGIWIFCRISVVPRKFGFGVGARGVEFLQDFRCITQILIRGRRSGCGFYIGFLLYYTNFGPGSALGVWILYRILVVPHKFWAGVGARDVGFL